MPPYSTPGVYVEETPQGPREIVSVDSRVTAFIGEAAKGSLKQAVLVSSFAEFVAHFGPLHPQLELGYAVTQFFANAGADSSAWIVRVPKHPTDAQFITALKLLDQVEHLGLLALPGIFRPLVLTAAAKLCRQRCALLLVDPSTAALSVQELQQAVAGITWSQTSYAALYFPWVRITDPDTGKPRNCAPSGTVAGVIARLDRLRGAWKSASGTDATMTGVQGLTYNLTELENDLLNRQGINSLRSFPNQGFLVWGARTLAGADSFASEWKYVAVRRTGNLIEESMRRGLAWCSFEPNDANLWSKVRVAVETYLTQLWRAGAFAGAKPAEAFFVRCDTATTTAADLAAGILVVEMGFAPIRPAEFIIVRIRLSSGAP